MYFVLQLLSLNHKLIHKRFTLILPCRSFIIPQLSRSISFCTTYLSQFFDFLIPFCTIFLTSSVSDFQLIAEPTLFLLRLISKLIHLTKFHPLGLKLDARFMKSSVNTPHLPFSSVQARHCLRKFCLNCTLCSEGLIRFPFEEVKRSLCSDKIFSLRILCNTRVSTELYFVVISRHRFLNA